MDKYTLNDVKLDIEIVKRSIADPDKAHCIEDQIMYRFIECLSIGMYEIDEAIEIAALIKECNELQFPRYTS